MKMEIVVITLQMEYGAKIASFHQGARQA